MSDPYASYKSMYQPTPDTLILVTVFGVKINVPHMGLYGPHKGSSLSMTHFVEVGRKSKFTKNQCSPAPGIHRFFFSKGLGTSIFMFGGWGYIDFLDTEGLTTSIFGVGRVWVHRFLVLAGCGYIDFWRWQGVGTSIFGVGMFEYLDLLEGLGIYSFFFFFVCECESQTVFPLCAS